MRSRLPRDKSISDSNYSKEKFDTLMQEGKITSEFLWAIFKPGTRVRTNHYLTKDIVRLVRKSRDFAH